MNRILQVTFAVGVLTVLVLLIMAGCKSDVGIYKGGCPSEGSFKADSDGKWKCEHLDNDPSAPLAWKKISN